MCRIITGCFMSFLRTSILCLPVLLVWPRALSAELPSTVKAFIRKHCALCHDADTQEGKLRLDTLAADFASPADVEKWGKVFSKLDRGEMPPKKREQPSQAQRQEVLDWLGPQVRAAVTARQRVDGRMSLRRLNRFEYQNTMRDLFGIQVNVMELLPEDGSAYGFDKTSSALTLSPVQVEKYLEAADLALDTALGVGPQPRLVQERYAGTELVASWGADLQRRLDGNGIVIFNSGYSPTELRRFRAPAPGSYRVRVSAYGYQSEDSPMTFRLYSGNFNVGGKTRLLGHFTVPPAKAKVIELTAHLESRGDSLKLIPYGTIPWQNKAEDYTGAGVAVEWLEVEGPLEAKDWPPATRRQLLGDVDLDRGSASDADHVLKSFASRAFRQPVSDADLAPYVTLITERLAKGVKFEDALRVGLKAILVSPRFLLLEEHPGKLDGHALASRLSYFLWSTLPDAELLAAAAKGELAQPDKLHAQVERMLNHPNARAFTEDFTGQWLGLRNIEFTTPDARLYPEFDELLQVSMMKETHAFFDELLTHDLSVLNFVESDFAMLNERLARHYDIPGVKGLEMRKVSLRPEWHRGGVLTHASVLKVTANGTTTSPVIRGAWLADRILGRPVPPPPANVPAVEPDIRGAKNIRDQLAKHRELDSCAACHAKMDPLGFAMESYDVIGGWRDQYRVTPDPIQRNDFKQVNLIVNTQPRRLHLGPKVDPGDILADGRRFRDLSELKQLLLTDKDQIARGLAEKLLIYATGQGLEVTDDPVVSEIVRQAKAKNYGLRELVHATIESVIFQNK